MSTTITSDAELRSVPDGTIISWLRILGDPTSEAVAFVRREVEWVSIPTAPSIPTHQRFTTWISPGGWDPMSIEQAGVTFPCQVIRWGDVSIESAREGYGPGVTASFEGEPAEAFTIAQGGTWAREAALDAAVQLFRGDTLYVLPRNGTGPILDSLFDVAARFEDWLERDVVADAFNDIVLPEPTE